MYRRGGKKKDSGGDLPAGYVPAVSLTSDGTARIETGIDFSNEHGLEMDVKQYVKVLTASRLAGNDNTIREERFQFFYELTPGRYLLLWGIPNYSAFTTDTSGLWSVNWLNNRKWMLNDLEGNIGDATAINGELVLFVAAASPLGSHSTVGEVRVSYLGEVIRHYLPCLDNNLVPAYYCIITDTTLYSNGLTANL